MPKRLIALLCLVFVLGAACSSDDDGDETPEETTTTVEDGGEPAGDDFTAEEQEVADDFEAAFAATTIEEASTSFEVTDDTEVIATAALNRSEEVGGVTVDVTDVTIEGDTAKVTFDVLIGGTPTLSNFAGEAIRTDDGWIVTIGTVCGLLNVSGAPPECDNYTAPSNAPDGGETDGDDAGTDEGDDSTE